MSPEVNNVTGHEQQYQPETTPPEVDQRYSPVTGQPNTMVQSGVSLNLSPIAARSSSTSNSGSGESRNSSDVSGTTDPALPVQVVGTSGSVASVQGNQTSPQGPIASAIQNTLGFGNAPGQIQTTPDYSNYYSAFYQAHSDPNAALAHSNYFPNHHFTVSSLIQKPSVGATVPYPKL